MKETVLYVYDDIDNQNDGSRNPGAVTVSIGWHGQWWELDISPDKEEEFGKLLWERIIRYAAPVDRVVKMPQQMPRPQWIDPEAAEPPAPVAEPPVAPEPVAPEDNRPPKIILDGYYKGLRTWAENIGQPVKKWPSGAWRYTPEIIELYRNSTGIEYPHAAKEEFMKTHGSRKTS
jgi:hypothetical protein